MKSTQSSALSEQTKYLRFLVYFLVVYAFIFIGYDLIRLWGFGYALEDIGIFHQAVWNTSNGNWFQTSVKYPFAATDSWLGFHFSPLPILLTAPFYKLFPSIETLCTIHVILVSIVAPIIYKICRRLGLDDKNSFLWSMVYLINPITIYHIMFSYQETSFAVPLMVIGIYFTISRNFIALLVTSFLLILTKEHHGVTVFGFGLFWWWYNKSKLEALILCALGIISAILVIFIIMPHFSPYGEHFMFSHNTVARNDYVRYQWLNQPIADVLSQAPSVIFDWKNIRLILILLAAFLFLPLNAIFFMLPVAGDFLEIILSQSYIQKALSFYYSAPMIPPFIIASAYVIKNFPNNLKKLGRDLKIIILILNIVGFCAALYIPLSKLAFISNNQIDWAIGPDFQALLSKIPADKSLITDQEIGSYISNRREITTYDAGKIKTTDYVALRLSPFDLSPVIKLQNKRSVEIAKLLVGKADWKLVYWKYPYALFSKNGEEVPKSARNEMLGVIEKQIEINRTVPGGSDSEK